MTQYLHQPQLYQQIAEQYGTPCYIYDENLLRANYQQFAENFADLNCHICFAVKANSNLAVLNILSALGAGADIVSAGELTRAMQANMRPIIFSGVGKNRAELLQAIHNPDIRINIESEAEFAKIIELCEQSPPAHQVKISVRINPDVDAGTHDKISTGRKGDKFGLSMARALAIYQQAKNIDAIQPYGVAVHIGSQILSLDPYRLAFGKINEFIATLTAQDIHLQAVDIGGGLGISYQQQDIIAIKDYAAMVKEFFGDYRIYMEPGRRIVGNMGELLSRVIAIKPIDDGHHIAILDAAMNDLMRPTLYQAWHDIVAVAPRDGKMLYDFVGPICETGDKFAEKRTLNLLQENDLIIIKDCGAYGAVMASAYNSRDIICEVMVRGNDTALVRRRIGIEELLSFEQLADWQK